MAQTFFLKSGLLAGHEKCAGTLRGCYHPASHSFGSSSLVPEVFPGSSAVGVSRKNEAGHLLHTPPGAIGDQIILPLTVLMPVLSLWSASALANSGAKSD